MEPGPAIPGEKGKPGSLEKTVVHDRIEYSCLYLNNLEQRLCQEGKIDRVKQRLDS